MSVNVVGLNEWTSKKNVWLYELFYGDCPLLTEFSLCSEYCVFCDGSIWMWTVPYPDIVFIFLSILSIGMILCRGYFGMFLWRQRMEVQLVLIYIGKVGIHGWKIGRIRAQVRENMKNWVEIAGSGQNGRIWCLRFALRRIGKELNHGECVSMRHIAPERRGLMRGCFGRGRMVNEYDMGRSGALWDGLPMRRWPDRHFERDGWSP